LWGFTLYLLGHGGNKGLYCLLSTPSRLSDLGDVTLDFMVGVNRDSYL